MAPSIPDVSTDDRSRSRSKSRNRAHFAEGTHVINGDSPVYMEHDKRPRVRRNDSSYDDDSTSEMSRSRGRHRRRAHHRLTPDNRRLPPSLTFDFQFNKNTTSNVQQPVSTRQSYGLHRSQAAKDAKDYRSRMYLEKIYSVSHSRYTSGIYGYEDPKMELVVNSRPETIETEFSELYRWM